MPVRCQEYVLVPIEFSPKPVYYKKDTATLQRGHLTLLVPSGGEWHNSEAEANHGRHHQLASSHILGNPHLAVAQIWSARGARTAALGYVVLDPTRRGDLSGQRSSQELSRQPLGRVLRQRLAGSTGGTLEGRAPRWPPAKPLMGSARIEIERLAILG